MSTITFISVSEAAKIVGVSNETIRSLCKAGTLRFQKKQQLYYPCKEDVNRYVNSISKIHSIRRDIERYSSSLQKEKEELRVAYEDIHERLENLNTSVEQVIRIIKTLPYVLEHLSKSQENNLTTREVEVLQLIFRGASYKEAGTQLQITGSRVGQIWDKVLSKFAQTKNEIEIKNEEICKLRKHIEQLYVEIDRLKDPTSMVEQEKIQWLVMPISALGFSNRTESGLARIDVHFVLDLVRCKRNDIRKVPNFGNKSIDELDSWLKDHGLCYEMDIPAEITLAKLQDHLSK